MARAVQRLDIVICGWSHIGVVQQDGERRARRLSFEHAGYDMNLIVFFARRRHGQLSAISSQSGIFARMIW